MAAEGPSTPANLKDIIREVVMEERAYTRACIASLEGQFLRPPLAADKRPKADVGSAAGPSTSGQPQAPKPSKGKGKGKKSAPTPSTMAGVVPEPSVAAVASNPPAQDAEGPWTKVGKNGKAKGKKPSQAAKAAAAPTMGKKVSAPAAKKTVGRKLVPPKTAAVTVTVTPEAAERGETYESVLTRARARVNPAQLGIGAVTCCRTQTGARIFEFPGATGGQNADLFAEKLREVIADVAKVARPTKSTTLEVTDLDDSVTKEEVVAAIAAAGGCPVDAVRGREIRPGRGGLGAMRLQCPVIAAKAVMAKGRLLVGFSSVVVRALEDEPMRCFKCFGIGHTRAMCPSAVDRADLCFRCGTQGHLAATCKAEKPRSA